MNRLSPRSKWLAVSIAAPVLVTVALICCTGRFKYTSFCSICGAERFSTEWQPSFWKVGLFTRSQVFDTPFSRVLLTNGIVQPHPHNWLFAQGHGNGVLCGLGPGDKLQTAVGSEELAAFILKLDQIGEIQFRNRMMKGILNPDTSRFFVELALEAESNRVTSDSQLRDWIAVKSAHLDDEVAEHLRN